MKTTRTITLLVAVLILMNAFTAPGCAQQTPPRMKMTTPVPESMYTSDRYDTAHGTLEFVDGVPTEETARKVWDQLDFQRAVECMIMCTPAASLNGFRRFMRECGPDNETMVYWHGRMDSRVLILTPNTTVVYTFMWIDLKDGPLVMETPPNVLGIIDNAWFHYVTDFGNAGPDKGKGGKYLLLPPDYEGEIPDGYIVRKSETYGHWLAMRGFMTNFEADPVVDNMKKYFKLYPLGSQPKAVNWVDCAGKEYNTLHAQDATFFNEVNEVVQEEPASAWDTEVLGMLAEIGIRKGQPFKPDARMKKILTDAAAWGTAAQRTIIWRNRNKNVLIWPDSKSWEVGFAGGSHEFVNEGIRLINERVRFHYYATGITPAMVRPPTGAGSQYVIGLRDEKGKPLDGSKTYRIHVPSKVPAKRFWDITVYDNQTRSLIQTDAPYPGVTSSDPKVTMNADGTCDVYIGPKKPAEAKNWIQTIPGKGFNILWRIYSPTQVWYDGGWRPSEIELVK